MNFEGGRHCKVIRLIGVPLGLWPYRRTSLDKIKGAIVLTIIVLCILTQLAVFITHEFSMDLFLKIVTGIVPLTVYVVKYYAFTWNTDEVKYMFEWIQSDYDSLTNERELRMIEKFADRGATMNKLFLYGSPTILIFIISSFLPEVFNQDATLNDSHSLKMPIKIEYFVDHDRYFYWIILHIDVSVVLGISILIVTETIFIYFTFHACGLFEIIGDRVERVLESSILNFLRGKTYLSIHDQLVATIQLHQRVLVFIAYLNTSFLPQYCILVIIGVISLSMNLYILAKEMLLMKVTSEMLTALLLVIVHFFYMGFGNYIGQLLLDKGDELFTKTYYARWHESPLPVQKMLLFIRQRSMEATGLELGGIYTCSMEFFSRLLNTSMSYFTVLYSTA